MTTRVHITDDDPLVRMGLTMMLGVSDTLTVVGEASNGEEAVRFARTGQADIMIIDIRMPVMDGIEATRVISALENPPGILILTTFEADEYVFAALQAGASGFLLKDTPPRELIDAVHVVARGQAMLSPTHTRSLIDRYSGGSSRKDEARARLSVLSDRERDVVRLVARGFSNSEIARDLFVSDATVKAHLSHIVTKLGANRIQVAIMGHDAEL